MTQKTILIVDDDPHIRDVLQFALEKAGMRVVCAANGQEAVAAFARLSPTLIVLDINMPEMDGLEVCRELRKTSQVPILFLSSRDEEIDRIIGLEIGGDDYVTKPFSPRELVARINAILKRIAPTIPTQVAKTLTYGRLRIDADSYTAYWQSTALDLTATELSLLRILLQHPNKVYTRDELMDYVYENIVVSDRTIDSHIRHIRQKCANAGGNQVITTVHGIGYKLGSCQE